MPTLFELIHADAFAVLVGDRRVTALDPGGEHKTSRAERSGLICRSPVSHAIAFTSRGGAHSFPRRLCPGKTRLPKARPPTARPRRSACRPQLLCVSPNQVPARARRA